VDRDQHGRIGNRAESAEHRECDRRLIRSVLLRLTQQQRDLERPALRRRKLSDHELENRIEQIAETRIRDLTLRLGRPCRQDAVTDFLCLSGESGLDRKSTRLNSSHVAISYAVFCLKKKNNTVRNPTMAT